MHLLIKKKAGAMRKAHGICVRILTLLIFTIPELATTLSTKAQIIRVDLTVSASHSPRDRSGLGKARSHLIQGVPYVRWGDAAKMNYFNKAILNPSYAAAWSMLLQHWGLDPRILESERNPGQNWLKEQPETTANLEEVKKFIDKDIPVIFCPAFTEFAHRHHSAFAIYNKLKELNIPLDSEGRAELSPEASKAVIQTAYNFEESGKASGALGAWLPLDKFRSPRDPEKAPNIIDSVVFSCRLAIGYDDFSEQVIVHDPSLGPAWKIGYSDLEKMWRVTPWYIAERPPNHVIQLHKKATQRQASNTHYTRTPDNAASVYYVRGYAWQSIGKPENAEPELRKGLSLQGVSSAYQHLLNMEMAVTLAEQGRLIEALAHARRAIKIFPQSSRGWSVLANLLEMAKSRNTNEDREMQEARANAKKFCNDQDEKIVANVLAQDFLVIGCRHGRNLLPTHQ